MSSQDYAPKRKSSSFYPPQRHVMGPGPAETPQRLVRTGEWQAAEAEGGWTLVTCVVVPGFTFDGFELAPEGWSP